MANKEYKVGKFGIQSNAKEIDSKYKTDFKYLSKLGYKYLDFQEFVMSNNHLYSDNDKDFYEYLKGLKEEANKYDMSYSQVHALWGMLPNQNFENFDFLSAYKKAVYGTYLLGAPYLVIHPISPTDWNEPFNISGMKETTKYMIGELMPLLKKYNVKIAIENLPFKNDFFSPLGTYEFVKEINSDFVVMCVDTGHFNIFRNLDVYDTMKKIGDKVKVFHIHDNNSWTDSHNFPFMGNFDWKSFAKSLKDLNYDGVLSLETCAPHSLIGTPLFDKLNENLFETLKYIDSLRR